jgi:hypothetical protein
MGGILQWKDPDSCVHHAKVSLLAYVADKMVTGDSAFSEILVFKFHRPPPETAEIRGATPVLQPAGFKYFAIASAWAIVCSSVTVVPKISQLFQPIGGVGADFQWDGFVWASANGDAKANKTTVDNGTFITYFFGGTLTPSVVWVIGWMVSSGLK